VHLRDEPSGALLHPASALAILALDWLLFSGTVISGGSLLLVMSLAGVALGAGSTYLIQSRLAGDRGRTVAWKSAVAGVIVGLPFPLGGTLVGGAVLAASGLGALRGR
jgi:hypothetical protein